jgi:K+-transporting ATPase ATPase C chain
MIFKQMRISILILLFFSILTGLIYPFLITGISQVLFNNKANGSLIEGNHQLKGSKLIGQYFDDPKYFWGRPSATTPFANNASSSGASNLGPTNPALLDGIKSRIAQLHQADPQNKLAIPVDLVTASSSGLDPEISPVAAYYQVHRIAQKRHLSEARVKELVAEFTQHRQFGLLGEPRVNVLELNLALDKLTK